jgi:hypothetical protein
MRLPAPIRRCRCVRSAHRRRAVFPLMHRLSLNRPAPLAPAAASALCSVTHARTHTATRLSQIVVACCAIIFMQCA